MNFKKPLPKDEEKLYIDKLFNGDDEESKYARSKLIEHNMKLVSYIAHKFLDNNDTIDELISIGTIGLIKAIDSFKNGKCTIATYASKCIQNEILMHMRSRNKRILREVSLYGTLGTDKDGNELHIIDILYDDKPPLSNNIEKTSEIKKAIKIFNGVLNTREQRVLTMLYGLDGSEPVNQAVVADVLGISRSYVSRIKIKALSKLRVEILKEDRK